MTFSEFKKSIESHPNVDGVYLLNDMVQISFKNGYSRFPLKRQDKLIEWRDQLVYEQSKIKTK